MALLAIGEKNVGQLTRHRGIINANIGERESPRFNAIAGDPFLQNPETWFVAGESAPQPLARADTDIEAILQGWTGAPQIARTRAQRGQHCADINPVTSPRHIARYHRGRVVGGFLYDEGLVEVEENRFYSHGALDVQNFCENLGGMVARIDAVIDTRDFTLLIDEEADPLGVLRLGLGAGAISERDFTVAVG